MTERAPWFAAFRGLCWPGILARVLYAVALTGTLTGWLFLGWQFAAGAGVALAFAVQQCIYSRLTVEGIDPFAARWEHLSRNAASSYPGLGNPGNDINVGEHIDPERIRQGAQP